METILLWTGWIISGLLTFALIFLAVAFIVFNLVELDTYPEGPDNKEMTKACWWCVLISALIFIVMCYVGQN